MQYLGLPHPIQPWHGSVITMVFQNHVVCCFHPWLHSTGLPGRSKELKVFVAVHIFPPIQQKELYSAFPCPSNPNCVCRSIPSYIWLWFGLAKVIINYTDIVLAPGKIGLLDSFGSSSELRLWGLISAFDFNNPSHGPSGALFCLCRLCRAGTRRALDEGASPPLPSCLPGGGSVQTTLQITQCVAAHPEPV